MGYETGKTVKLLKHFQTQLSLFKSDLDRKFPITTFFISITMASSSKLTRQTAEDNDTYLMQ